LFGISISIATFYIGLRCSNNGPYAISINSTDLDISCYCGLQSIIDRRTCFAERFEWDLELDCVHINTRASPAPYGFLYTSSGKHEFVCISLAAVRIHTSIGYLKISLVRIVSVQVMFLSNSWEVNYPWITLI